MPSSSEVELAHAVLMPGFAGTSAPAWLLEAIGKGLGGVCYFGHNIESPDQVARLSGELHDAGAVVISVDEEGGTVTRLHADHGSPHVGAAVLGRGDDVEVTGQLAELIAGEVAAAGIDLDLAPVADVNSNPANPVIGVRSFGADPSRTAAHVEAYVRGVQRHGVAACAKHFPGHGDTAVDSHLGVPTVTAGLDLLRSRELVPFAAAIDAGVRCVMTAHAVFTAIDDQPATISVPVLRLLRDELGFDGVIISDAIDMGAISGTVGFAEGVVRALEAGVDLVGLGNPVLGGASHGSDAGEFAVALSAVLAALDQGRLTTERLARSAERIGSLRDWCADQRTPAPARAGDVADRAAAAALRTRGEVALRGPVHVVDARRRRSIASGRLSSLLADELVTRVPGSSAESAFDGEAAAEGRATSGDMEEQEARSDLGRPDVILTGTPGQDAAESAVLEALLHVNPQAVVVCLGWSGRADDLAAARNAVFAYGDSRPTARAVADLICR